MDEFSHFNFERFSDRLRFLHGQLTHPASTFDEQSLRYLSVGCIMFGAEKGLVVSSVTSMFRKIITFESASELVSHYLTEKEEKIYNCIVAQEHVSTGSIARQGAMKSNSTPETNNESINYIGVPLVVDNNKNGVLCFVSGAAFDLNTQDIESLEMMAEGVARMIELQKVKEQTKKDDKRSFASPGVKSLDEYVEESTIPEAAGVSARVVDVIQNRIGGAPLGIDDISKELDMTKRTLQRRLQQQNMSFAQLRDQVRYHHSVNYLTRHTLSIDAISTALDFSDRTSFTNAFKRWTSLSPSTFRKLFRDYV